MANYYGTMRTNYFEVTDEKRYEFLFSGLCGEDNIEDFSESDGLTTKHGFGSYSSVDWKCPIGYSVRKFMSIYNPKKDSPKVLFNDVDENTQIGMEEIESISDYYVVGFSRDELAFTILIAENTEGWEYYDYDYEFDTFIKELQLILPDDEIFAYEEVGNEKLRYLVGYACVMTNKEQKWFSLEDMINRNASELLGKEVSVDISY